MKPPELKTAQVKPPELTDGQIDAITKSTWPEVNHKVVDACRKFARKVLRQSHEIKRIAKMAVKKPKPLKPVDGDLLPPIGSKVLIHLARRDRWVEHTVVGYYAWGGLLDPHTHRVFVRVLDGEENLHSRALCDVRPVESSPPPTPTSET